MGFFIFIALVIGFSIFSWKKKLKRTQEQWQIAAHQLDLRYSPEGHTLGIISGTIRGHRVEVSTFTKKQGNNNKTYMRYQVKYRQHLALDLKITHQGTLHRVGKLFGLQDIEVGNSAFDRQVLLRGRDPAAVREYLTPVLQKAIRGQFLSYPNSMITQQLLRMEKHGTDADAAIIAGTVGRMLSLCDEMMKSEKIAPLPKNARRHVPPPLPPSVTAASPPLRPKPVERPKTQTLPKIPERTQVPESPELPKAPEELLSLLDQMKAEMLNKKLPSEPVEAAVQPASNVCESEAIDLQKATEKLFGVAASGSLLATKLFEEEFKDRWVSGSGTLKRVSRFSYDPIFANMKGVKALFHICELTDAYSKIKISAEVAFPLEEYDALIKKMGSEQPIEGKLIAQDTLLHHLYITK